MTTLLALLLFVTMCSAEDTMTWGFNLEGTRYIESNLNTKNVHGLTQKWKTNLCGPIVSSPSVVGNNMWVGDFAGCLTRLDKRTGAIIWQKNLTADYGLRDKAYSRNTPTYHKGMLIIPQSGRWGYVERSYGVWLMGVNASTGALVWKTQVSDFNRSYLTGSPNVEDGKIYIGLSSGEEAEPAVAALEGRAYNCCHFGGKMLSYAVSNGAKLWETPTSPPELIGPGQYAGGAIFTYPTIYKDYVYASTANLYWVPQSVTNCIQTNGINSSCIDRRVLFNSVIKFNKHTGAILASFRADTYDAWNAACLFGGALPGCPTIMGPDAAFADSPMIVRLKGKGHKDKDHKDKDKRHKDKGRKEEVYVAIGQKSGDFWFLKASDLSLVWNLRVGPGSTSGGVMYASTVNKNGEIFAGSTNGGRQNYTTANGELINYGAYVKMSTDGKIIWERPAFDKGLLNGALASSNDLVFGQSSLGKVVALDAGCGDVKWSFQTGITSSIAGVTIDEKTIYFGTGPVVQFIPGGVPVPHPLYAFGL